ncbi:hypothetical protein NTGHW29_200013 [Candidatus Nitrotoga sp. HW29]|nr:hypothetical protein NTGHW29_200013 [Candidatus Nitrotoga sp. HW29]
MGIARYLAASFFGKVTEEAFLPCLLYIIYRSYVFPIGVSKNSPLIVIEALVTIRALG